MGEDMSSYEAKKLREALVGFKIEEAKMSVDGDCLLIVVEGGRKVCFCTHSFDTATIEMLDSVPKHIDWN